MSAWNTELAFVGSVWWSMMRRPERARLALDNVPPEALEHAPFSRVYAALGALFMADRPLHPGEPSAFEAVFPVIYPKRAPGGYPEASEHVFAYLEQFATSDIAKDPAVYAREILTDSQARSAVEAVRAEADAVLQAAKVKEGEVRPAQAILDRVGTMVVKLDALASKRPFSQRARSREDVVEALRAEPRRKGYRGIPWPWGVMEKMLGTDIQPGGVYAFSAMPGNGKTLLAVNLFGELVLAGHPTIPTLPEMADQWMVRGTAARAWVEQQVAELGRWDADDERVCAALMGLWKCGAVEVRERMAERKRRWDEAVDELASAPWHPLGRVGVPMTFADVISGWRAIRRAWPGRHVVAILDHAHACREKKLYERISEFLAEVKAFAEADEAGFSVIVFFQPRKTERDATARALAKYTPLPYTEVAGNVGQFIDTHASLIGQWTEIDHEGRRDEWGQLPCKLDDFGVPVRIPARQRGSKWKWPHARVDKSHLYMYSDKGRVMRVGDSEGYADGIYMLSTNGLYGRVQEMRRWENASLGIA